MLSSLSVRNYRGFRQFAVRELNRVNLFVGKNNTGKTSILEAAATLSASSVIESLSTIAHRRGETIEPEFQESLSIDLRHFFFGHSLEPETKLELDAGPNNSLLMEIAEDDDTRLDFSDPEFFFPKLFRLNVYRRGEQVEVARVSEDGAMYPDFSNRRRATRSIKSERTVFITPDSLGSQSLRTLYNEVITSASEDILVRALRLLDSEVTGVFFLATQRSSFDGKGGILIGRSNGERIPIGSFGDGMRRLLALAMSGVNARNGTLFIDEIDTGLHYSVMQDLWKLIIGSASDQNTQIFSTTHSLDCIRGLHYCIEQNPEFAHSVALHKIDNAQTEAVTFTGRELRHALLHEVEFR